MKGNELRVEERKGRGKERLRSIGKEGKRKGENRRKGRIKGK